MKDKLYIGLIAGLILPLVVVFLFYIFRFNHLSLPDFIQHALILKVHFKLIAVGVFIADLALFFLFYHYQKNNASRGVIIAVFIYFFIMLFSNLS